MLKDELRKTIKERRNTLSSEKVAEQSAIIADKLFQLSEYQSARTVCCYLSFQKEVSTRRIIKELLHSGKKVCVPYITGEGVMAALQITGLDGLNQNRYGIEEPDPAISPQVKAEDIDLFFIPAVCFDRITGHRIGYGKGYYDRFLKNAAAEAVKVGLAMEMQLQPIACADSTDIAVDIVITENGVYYTEEYYGRGKEGNGGRKAGRD